MADKDLTYWNVGLDAETATLLLAMSQDARRPPADLIASLVRDVLVDDAAEHKPLDPRALN